MSNVTVTSSGFVVDASVLGAAFSITPATVPEKLRSGEITSRCETGMDADAGRWRLTFFSDGRALRLVVDKDGTVLSRSTFPAPRPRTGQLDLQHLPPASGASRGRI